jgi:Uncharacterized protein conserved in bacteria (DUF2314)
MVGEFLNAIVSWETFLISLLVFGFAPGAVLRLIVLAFRRDDPRRREMLAELYRVPRLERPYWVFEQLEVALFEGIWERLLWAGAGRIYDRWHLNPGLTYDEQHSAGYPISDEEFEEAIERGMLVKLSFSTSDVWGRPNWGAEAMWVHVVAAKRRHFVGVLGNQPITIPRLDIGDTVKFKGRHIIDAIRDDDDLQRYMDAWASTGRATGTSTAGSEPPLPGQ